MKIKYSTPKELFKFIEDSYFIVAYKKKILKNKKYPFFNNIKRSFISFLGYIMLTIIFETFRNITGDNDLKVVVSIMFICVALSGINILNFLFRYNKIKNKSINGILTIDEEGISDEDEESKLDIKWKVVTFVIVGKYSVNILLENSEFYLRLPIAVKEKVIKGITKYSDIEIIDLTIKN